MFNRKLTLPTESRIHGDMYVRFGGRYGETYRRKTTRRPIPSLLLLHCEKEGYKIPRFCTFDCVQRLNKPGKDGEELPRVSVLRGEKSFPVMLTTFTCIHKETREKIKYDDYKKLSDEEKNQYNVYPKMQVFRVFNVAQTNLQEARPELWEKLERENSRPAIENGEHFSFVPVDTMIRDNLWICPITPLYQDKAYYSISNNEIIVPEKEQFKSGESFYGTLFHEMTHSTGAEGVLDRFKPSAFGSPEYAREELVAELGSALVAQRYGMTKHIKEDSCAYLKSWLDELKESPQFIKTTLLDVKKATSMITQRVDKIAQELEQNVGEKQENGVAAKEKIYYSSVVYLQSSDDTRQLDELRDKGDYEGLLTLAKEYYDGNGINEKYTYPSATNNKGDSLIVDDGNFAVVYNGSVGGTYEVMLKFTEQEIRDHIRRYGVDNAGDTIKGVAREMAAEQFSAMASQKIPAFEMPNGDVLYVKYNKEADTLDVGQATNAGLVTQHRFPYDHNIELDANLRAVNGKLNELEEYRAELQEAEYGGGMRR